MIENNRYYSTTTGYITDYYFSPYNIGNLSIPNIQYRETMTFFN